MNTNPEPTPHQRQSSVEKVAFLATEFGFLSVLGFWGGGSMGWCCRPGDTCRNLLRQSAAFPWNAHAGRPLARVLQVYRKPRAFFSICHVRRGICNQPNLGQKPYCGSYGGAFKWMPISLHSLVPGRNHKCTSGRGHRRCWNCPCYEHVLLEWTEPRLDAMYRFNSCFAVGLCWSCLVTVCVLPTSRLAPSRAQG